LVALVTFLRMFAQASGESPEDLQVSPATLVAGFFPFVLVGGFVGSACGFLLSPLLYRSHDQPRLFARVAVSTLIGGVVSLVCACTTVSGAALMLRSLPFVVVAVVSSFNQSAHLFSGAGVRSGLGRVLRGPALALLALGAWAYMNRLPEDEAQLVALLGHHAGETAEAASEKLRELGGLEPFLRALEHSDPSVRESAVRTVGASELAEVVPALMRATEDPVRRVRVAALGSLFHMGTEQPLLDALDDPDPKVRYGLCLRVTWCGDASHIPAIEGLLDDTDESVRERAVSTIERLRDKTSGH